MAVDPREEAAHHGTLDEFRKFYRYGDATSFRSFNGETLLEFAAINPRLESAIDLVGFLLDDGADVGVEREDGLNVLHRFVSRHDNSELMVPIVQRLVVAGVNYNAVAKRIGTPIDVLYRMSFKKDENAVLPVYEYMFTLPDLNLVDNSLRGRSFMDRLASAKDYRPLLWRAAQEYLERD